MLKSRCYRCGWSLTLSPEDITAALEQAKAKKASYHVEHCPRCKNAIKLPLRQLQDALPRPRPGAGEPEKPPAES
jgi:hypothetical protein